MAIEVYSGGGVGSLEAQTWSPRREGFDALPNEQKGYEGISSLTVLGSSNLIPDNVRSGITLFGTNGSMDVCFFSNILLATQTSGDDYSITISLKDSNVDYTSIYNSASRIYIQSLFVPSSNYIVESFGALINGTFGTSQNNTRISGSYGANGYSRTAKSTFALSSDGKLTITYPKGGFPSNGMFNGSYAVFIG